MTEELVVTVAPAAPVAGDNQKLDIQRSGPYPGREIRRVVALQGFDEGVLRIDLDDHVYMLGQRFRLESSGLSAPTRCRRSPARESPG